MIRFRRPSCARSGIVTMSATFSAILWCIQPAEERVEQQRPDVHPKSRAERLRKPCPVVPLLPLQLIGDRRRRRSHRGMFGHRGVELLQRRDRRLDGRESPLDRREQRIEHLLAHRPLV